MSDREPGTGSQTLMRGLDVIEAVGERPVGLAELAAKLELTKSTAHRLASALVDRGYLAHTPREGYRLGPRLLALGHLAHLQADLIQVARPYLEALAERTQDTVHLGVLDDDRALYLDKIAGRRRVTISSRVGDRHPLASTGLGKALMLDHPADYWRARFVDGDHARNDPAALAFWTARMESYAKRGIAFDLEENEDQIRCVAAPVRDATGRRAWTSAWTARRWAGLRKQAPNEDHAKKGRESILEVGWTAFRVP